MMKIWILLFLLLSCACREVIMPAKDNARASDTTHVSADTTLGKPTIKEYEDTVTIPIVFDNRVKQTAGSREEK